jgi:protein O-GlcNAc transferase
MTTIPEAHAIAREHHMAGRLDMAERIYRQILQVEPNHWESLHLLGVLAGQVGQYAQGVELIGAAIRVNEQEPVLHANLGRAHAALGHAEAAIACYQRALRLKPDFAETHFDLAFAHQALGQLDEAAASYQHALDLEPNHAVAHNNLGVVLKDKGQLADALACFRRAVHLQPDFVQADSNLLHTLLFSPDYDSAAIYDEHRRWNRQHAEPLARSIRSHDNDPSPERRLRIGYISPDFRDHCQIFYTVPLFSTHDHENFEICCYADVPAPDEATNRLQSYADLWRNIAGLTDEQVANMIRQDGIDILVDLTMHMARSRLLVFAHKPAPVQVCWLAYPGTTGLSTIDYRLTDPHLDPHGQSVSHYSEESIRLPDTFWCYDPLVSEPAVNPLPALKNGYITFGCLGSFGKVNAPTLKLWARVLRAVVSSRLILLARAGQHRENALSILAREGITSDRVTFVANRPRLQYLELFHQIDVGLDTLPYNGHTTSLDSYWMGVPVVTLAGQTVVGRAGVCQLTNLGLTELIAWSPEAWVHTILELARDLPRLSMLRATLRERMRKSPLMDGPRFARHVEAAYRNMWQRWCSLEVLKRGHVD